MNRAILQRCYANRNGKLDPAELRKLAQEVNRGGGERGRGDTPPAPGARGRRGTDGKGEGTPPGPTERGKRGQRGQRGQGGEGDAGGADTRPSPAEMLKRYDANGNGKLDPSEREKMRADMQRRRDGGDPPIPRPRRGGNKPPTDKKDKKGNDGASQGA